MNLKFMKEDALLHFKENLKYNYKNYLLDSADWIYEKYENPLEESRILASDFSLDMTQKEVSIGDCNNVRIMYKNLKHISNTQAMDERLWAGLSHSIFWDYLQYRTKINEEKITENKILFSYFFKRGGKRILVINPLTRLWWVGRQVYDPSNEEDPFYALEFLKRDFSTKVLNLFSYNYTNNPKIVRAILVALAQLEKENNITNVLEVYKDGRIVVDGVPIEISYENNNSNIRRIGSSVYFKGNPDYGSGSSYSKYYSNENIADVQLRRNVSSFATAVLVWIMSEAMGGVPGKALGLLSAALSFISSSDPYSTALSCKSQIYVHKTQGAYIASKFTFIYRYNTMLYSRTNYGGTSQYVVIYKHNYQG